jgi:hypothetical protein
MLTKTYLVKQNEKTVYSITITDPTASEDKTTIPTYSEIQWDSKTGMVTAKVNGARTAIPYIGKSYGTLQPAPFEVENIYAIEYNYCYY